jgi:hypothetical protein
VTFVPDIPAAVNVPPTPGPERDALVGLRELDRHRSGAAGQVAQADRARRRQRAARERHVHRALRRREDRRELAGDLVRPSEDGLIRTFWKRISSIPIPGVVARAFALIFANGRVSLSG